MGCTNSTPGDGPGARPAQNTAVEQTLQIELPDVQWEINKEWSEIMEAEWKNASANGNAKKFRASFQPFLDFAVRKWLDKAEPACAEAGTIEDMGETNLRVGGRKIKYPAKVVLTLDDDFTGVVYSGTMIIIPPLKGKGADEPWMKAGAALQTEEMRGAQRHMLTMFTLMREDNVNLKHALIHVFMGADLVSCKFTTTANEPTITMLPHQDKPNEQFVSGNENLRQSALGDPENFPVQFPSLMFTTMYQRFESEYPGCTTWDEGEFPFTVDGVPYQYPTRLLAARDFNKMSERVDSSFFKVMTDSSDAFLSRNLDPEKDPGGIVCMTLILGIDPKVIWPSCGDYTDSPAVAAAEKALHEHVKTLHKNGKVRACAMRISIGSDRKNSKFVGDVAAIVPEPKRSEPQTVPESKRRQCTDLDGFLLSVKEQPKHELFESESHFQAIKEHMRVRVQENPEFFNAIVPQVAVMSAKHFLSANFPGCEVVDEGEFPVTLPDGTEIKVADARLILAKDPKQEPKSIVAALHVVPNPGGGEDTFMVKGKKNWLESKEMKGAEYALLELLKKLHAEGKVSEVDCMAQVMMETDATIYQFVEGSKFIDYSDERMAQIKWY
ncbi:unnamed protein product [Clonostachys rosea]|uniref:Uncharacterized protein n=1 Tax=Bionectria ochroleuca TaxID=29856 RepID=A0ABY6UMY3_BIOOC|nr:unnamed protein product [Clonostachys rosea]